MLPRRGRQQPVSLEEQQPTNREKAASARLWGWKTCASPALSQPRRRDEPVGRGREGYVLPPSTPTTVAMARPRFLGRGQGQSFEEKLEMDILKINICVNI